MDKWCGWYDWLINHILESLKVFLEPRITVNQTCQNYVWKSKEVV